MRLVLMVAGEVVTVVAVLVVSSWNPPVPLLVAVLAAAVTVAVLAILRGRGSWTDRTFAAVVYAWLYGVQFLLGVGLLRRVTQPPELLSFAEAQIYAGRTDAFLLWGLVLNAVLPLGGAVTATLVPRARVAPFGRVAIGAAAIYLVMGLIAAQATAGLFGHLPRWEKPRAAAVAMPGRRRRVARDT